MIDPTTPKNYLTEDFSLQSWLFTTDHKRIAILYAVAITFFFAIGGLAATIIRIELMTPNGSLVSSDMYNKLFSIHGIVMIWFFLVPSIPTTFGNFLIPMMIGAKDMAFPKINIASWWVYLLGACFTVTMLILGGVDTGWTFYAPYSTAFSNSYVILAAVGVFIVGFSSIMTGLNIVTTVHRCRAPGMTWFKLPIFIWSNYATAIIMLLATPVLAMTLVLIILERGFHVGIFDPKLGGDPLLFQHLFWFYSHPAVYIMILPGMGVTTEIITCFSRKRVFGYKFVAFCSMAIAFIGFLVWGHHMFVSGQSIYASMIFSILSFIVAVPSAIKVFNWCLTMYEGAISLTAPMLYALSFVGLFTIGGLSGLMLASIAVDVHVTDTYFVVAHFHYIMVGAMVTAYFGAMHFWWPKITGKLYSEFWGRLGALFIFAGFNLTFFPQYIMGYLGMPRRYHTYPPDFQIYHIMSSLGASVLAVGYVLPFFYLFASLIWGKDAGPNPWRAKGLEWTTSSPPPKHNFHTVPIVTEEAYEYPMKHLEEEEAHV